MAASRCRLPVSVLLAGTLLAYSLGGSEANAGTKPACSKDRHPSTSINYDDKRIKATFTLKLECTEGTSRFQVQTRAKRNESTVGGSLKYCTDKRKTCQISVKVAHRAVEHATYEFLVFYRNRARKQREVWVGPYTCTSALITYRCDPS